MKIGVVGSINMDKVATVAHIPRKGETLLASNYMETFGGKGANQAVAIAKLGGDVTLFGCVGDDWDGQRTMAHMKEVGVAMDAVETIAKTPTGRAFINVGEKDNTIVVVSGANSHVTEAYLAGQRQRIEAMDILLIQNEIPGPSVTWLLENFGPHKTIIYNPAPYRDMDRAVVKKATWLTPNESEAASLLGQEADMALQSKCLLTRGSKGIAYMEYGQVKRIPAIDCHPVDTTGAGDTFNGALAYGLAKAWSLERAITFANVAAGISTEKEGAQQGMPTLEKVMARWVSQ